MPTAEQQNKYFKLKRKLALFLFEKNEGQRDYYMQAQSTAYQWDCVTT